jgi:hypothetical protein
MDCSDRLADCEGGDAVVLGGLCFLICYVVDCCWG